MVSSCSLTESGVSKVLVRVLPVLQVQVPALRKTTGRVPGSVLVVERIVLYFYCSTVSKPVVHFWKIKNIVEVQGVVAVEGSWKLVLSLLLSRE